MKKLMGILISILVLSMFACALGDDAYTWIGSQGKDKASAVAIQMGQAYAGELETRGQRWVKFTTPGDSGYTTVYFKNLSIKGYLGLNLYTSVDERLRAYVNSYSEDSSFNLQLDANTTYYIKFYDATNYNSLFIGDPDENYNGDGNYKITVSFRKDNESNTLSGADNISMGTEHVASIDGKGDVDYFSFVAPTAGKYTLSAKNLTIGRDVIFQVQSEIEEILGSKTISKSRSADCVVELRANTKYYVKVFVYNDYWSEGNYSFLIGCDHTWDEGTVLKKPISGYDGEIQYTCTVCGAKRIESLKALDSKIQNGSAYYRVDAGGKAVYLRPYYSYPSSIAIPATITIDNISYPVTSIEKGAMNGNKYLTKVSIGKNVTSIGASAFKGCTSLTKITIPANISKIGRNAFKNCSKLKTIKIKTTKLTTGNVGSGAFKGIDKKATFKVPKSKLKAYKKMLVKKGAPKTANIKK